MGEIEAAHAAAGPHGETFRQLDASLFLRVEKFPENLLLSVVGAGGVTRRRPDASVFFSNEVINLQFFNLAIAPFLADALV